ncbi:class I SAM-dependent methyltransferase [Streptomyces sp. NPDC050164]|uniref:class I SAM-dependent methyltransferase n=1 Tax=Streptomyces sp. NPDC050164 TaxID=3365605 RepID=UPI003792810D
MDGGSDHAYAAAACVWGTDPEPLLTELASETAVEGWQVLDAGCGEGRNAAHLARQGATVRALDVSALALQHAGELWGDVPGIVWERADLRQAELLPDHYDLVVIDSVFHWLADATDADQVMRRLRATTRPGGRHAMCVFNDRRQELEGHQVPPRFIPTHAWCLSLYEGWIIETVRDETIVSSHPGAPKPHGHSVTKLVARRPLATR